MFNQSGWLACKNRVPMNGRKCRDPNSWPILQCKHSYILLLNWNSQCTYIIQLKPICSKRSVYPEPTVTTRPASHQQIDLPRRWACHPSDPLPSESAASWDADSAWAPAALGGSCRPSAVAKGYKILICLRRDPKIFIELAAVTTIGSCLQPLLNGMLTKYDSWDGLQPPTWLE